MIGFPPPIPPPKDTKYIRHERIQSELLTKFIPRGIERLLKTAPPGADLTSWRH
jgi:hypothetical protein